MRRGLSRAMTWLLLVGTGSTLWGIAGRAADRPSGTASVSVADLRCEYLQDPLGIDAQEPRLSWRLEANDAAARGLRQKVYQVLVSSTPERLAQDQGDLWDSGDVVSGQSVQIVYGGRPLASGMQCFWKVRVRDQAGAMSAWSKPARWTMGLLLPSDWKAQWIGSAERKPDKAAKSRENTLPDPWLRKAFSLPAAPHRATVYVASVGYHELYVNGQKIGDAVLQPAVTDHSTRARYVTYEIADRLHPGENVIGLWLGTSWSIYPYFKTADKPQAPIAIAQADIVLPGGQTQRITTDATWKTHASPNTLLGVWNFTNFGGELYDATREVPNWCQTGLDDSAWQPAQVYSPRLTLSAQMVEPNRRVKAVRPVAIEQRPDAKGSKPGDFRVDMGVNFAGFVEIDLRGKPGQRIEFQFSEHPKQVMTHRLHSAYVLGPTGKGTFCNRFNYGVGRWITITGLDAKPALEDVRGYLVRTDYRPAADFQCSNKLLNDIYRTTLWTFENLSLGGYVVDCPQRERMGYGGDAHASTETAMNSFHMGAFYTKWAQDWRDVQGKSSAWGVGVKAGQPGAGDSPEEGNLPYTAPTYWGGGGPGWSGYCVTLPWLMYRQYGDVRILQQQFPTIQRWLRFLESKSSHDMLVRYGGQWDFLGDWLWPGAKGVNGDTSETLFFNNCYWIYNLQTAARIAEAIGKGEAAAAYRQRAEAVRRAVHAKFFRPEDNSYVNGLQAYLSIALLVGLPPEDLRPAVAKRLEQEILVRRKGHFHAGITGGYFVIKALVDAGRDDLIFEMATKDDYPSWGDMLRRGATTLWESWEGNISLLHSSYLHLGLWYIEGLGGIQPDPQHAGFQSFVIRPGVLPGRLDWVKARYESLYGPIESAWRIEGGTLHVTVEIPPNTTARLLLPTKSPDSIRESGAAAAKSPGVKPVGTQNGRAVFELGSGRYSFESSL